MTPTAHDRWQQANQRALARALSVVRTQLVRHSARGNPAREEPPDETQEEPSGPPSALDTLCALFGLSSFERSALILCAGVELEAGFATLCAEAQGDPNRTYPTFSLTLAALPDAHWSALTPDAPLRRWRLIEIGAGGALTVSPLRIDERILHYLVGLSCPDARLMEIVEPVTSEGALVPSHQVLAERLAGLWERASAQQPLPVMQLCGEDIAGKRAIAAVACARVGWQLSALAAEALPSSIAELESLARLWEREALLTSRALLLDCHELDVADVGRMANVNRFIERVTGLVLATRDRVRVRQRLTISLEARKPQVGEQRLLWRQALGGMADCLAEPIEALTAQFNVSAQTIRAAGAEALGGVPDGPAALNGAATSGLSALLWDACRVQARPRLDDVAQRIEPAADWEALILPEPQKRILRDIAAHVQQRVTVYETWGFAAQGARGLGMSALFAGASGTGKTMAAEVLAHTLNLDLYRIDLSSIVSKYIGETEKNLRRVFDAAEEGGAILLFDEADALFGKRSEVKDSHDRYANIEVSYLLQRMETYRGLAILTTNLRSALDAAFLRRLRFIVHFPFPDVVQRAEIWRRVFPAQAPTRGLDADKLARLSVAGGNIRSIALNAAFLAADAGEPITMGHLFRAAQSEYAKLEKPLTDAETAGWL
jgi:hypothetical protein